MNKVLILEDDPLRIEWFKTQIEKFDSTDNPQKAIDLLEQGDYDYIYIDNDLLPEHYLRDTDCDKTTGLCLAKWLGENLDKSTDAKIIIHSLNWNGRARMEKAMNTRKNVQSIPYDKLQEQGVK